MTVAEQGLDRRMHHPLMLLVLLSAPAWLSWPFMAERKQRVLIEVLQNLTGWTRTCVRGR
ncbi:hypothetical protein ACFCX0_46705 [Streptomyces sp. NPDC056352]|uniref:hypothetical protein n=1 Tax=Streptomyces sp. NPDC056352 TaxID=3345791 RepID=UPI0035D9DFF6